MSDDLERALSALGEARRQRDEARAMVVRYAKLCAEYQSERDEARAENERLRAALGDVLLGADDTGERARYYRDVRPLPEDQLVQALCEAHGYGAVIDSVCRQWFLKDPDAAFVKGPCAAIARLARAALARPTGGPRE